jgi:import inner membrane translocase subunit TIM54
LPAIAASGQPAIGMSTPPMPPAKEAVMSSTLTSTTGFNRIRSLLPLKKLRLPSRNWLIFLGISSSLLGAYYYDRRECKRILQQYVDRVKHLAEQPAGTMEWPRKVTVYGSKWPGDDDYDKSIKYFRKYVKVRGLRAISFSAFLKFAFPTPTSPF